MPLAVTEPYGLGRVPVEEPEGRGVAAREVEGRDLQVTTVEVVLVQDDGSVDGDFFHVAPPHVVYLRCKYAELSISGV